MIVLKPDSQRTIVLKTEYIWEGQRIYGGPLLCEKLDAAYCNSFESRIRWDVGPGGFIQPCGAQYYLAIDGSCVQPTCKDSEFIGDDGKCT